MTSMHPKERYHHTIAPTLSKTDMVLLAKQVHSQVFRTDFTEPGFALIDFHPRIETVALRQFMVLLKDALDAVNQQKFNCPLTCLSMMRFDQQNTTKFHLDGAPEESYLMLGYESSLVQSELCIADYSRAAYDLHLTPQQYLTDFNPMFLRGEQQLNEYITRLESFDPEESHVLLINNSSLPFTPGERNTLGVLHQATILTPDPTRRRVVNSIMLGVSQHKSDNLDTLAMERDFLSTATG